MTSSESPLWEVILDETQFVMALVGIIANLLTLVTLMKNGDEFQDIILMLLKYQSLIDGINCTTVLLIFKLPLVTHTGNYVVDSILCHLWTTQHLYWTGMFLSTWNLVCLALERYICVCHPLKYHQLTKSKMRLIILFFFFLGAFYLLPGVFQTNMRSGYCVNELYWSSKEFATFFFIWVFSFFFAVYGIPTVLFIFAYGMVIYSFHKRAKSNLGASGTASVIDRASTELMKTAIVVTLIYLIAFSYVEWLFLLAAAGVEEYIMQSPKQKIGTFLSVINLVANPFVYASLLPSYRRSVKKTLCFFRQKKG